MVNQRGDSGCESAYVGKLFVMLNDLIQRITYQKNNGDDSKYLRVFNWLNEQKNHPHDKFEFNSLEFYWKIIDTTIFSDIILDDYNEWIFIYNKDIKIIGRIYYFDHTYMSKSAMPTIASLWLIEGIFPRIESDLFPIKIRAPHRINSPLHRLNYDLKRNIEKLYDPTKVLKQEVMDNKSTDKTIYLRE